MSRERLGIAGSRRQQRGGVPPPAPASTHRQRRLHGSEVAGLQAAQRARIWLLPRQLLIYSVHQPAAAGVGQQPARARARQPLPDRVQGAQQRIYQPDQHGGWLKVVPGNRRTAADAKWVDGGGRAAAAAATAAGLVVGKPATAVKAMAGPALNTWKCENRQRQAERAACSATSAEANEAALWVGRTLSQKAGKTQ